MFLNVLIFTGSVLAMRTFFVIYFVVHYLYVLLQAVARPHNLPAFITGKCVLSFVLALPEKQIPNQNIFKQTRKKNLLLTCELSTHSASRTSYHTRYRATFPSAGRE